MAIKVIGTSAVVADAVYTDDDIRTATMTAAKALSELFERNVEVQNNKNSGDAVIKEDDSCVVGISVEICNREKDDALRNDMQKYFDILYEEHSNEKRSCDTLRFCTIVNLERTRNICIEGQFLLGDCYNTFDNLEEAVEYIRTNVLALR